MSTGALVVPPGGHNFARYLQKLVVMQGRISQLVHFDVRIHDMSIFEW